MQEYFAYFAKHSGDPDIQKIANEVEAIPARMELLALAKDSPNKEEIKKDAYQPWLYENNRHRTNGLPAYLSMAQALGLIENDLNPVCLPYGSFALRMNLILARAFISKDDTEFYFIDNPVCKEKILKLPMMRASSWKGNLRWVAVKRLEGLANQRPPAISADDFLRERLQLVTLFGNEKQVNLDSQQTESYLDRLAERAYTGQEINRRYREQLRTHTQTGLMKGRLVFCPTYWDRIDLDIIAPHNRTTRTVSVPILLEVVPEARSGGSGAQGQFSLVYSPHNLIGKTQPQDILREALDDLTFTALCLEKLMLTYGFSAKRASGYGVIEQMSGELRLNAGDTPEGAGASQADADGISPMPTECESFLVDGEFPDYSKAQIQDMDWSNNKRTKYKRAREAWRAWHESTQQADQAQQQDTSCAGGEFGSFDKLKELIENLRVQLLKSQGDE